MTQETWRRMVAEHKHKKKLKELRNKLRHYNTLLPTISNYEQRELVLSTIHNIQLDIDFLTGVMPIWFREGIK